MTALDWIKQRPRSARLPGGIVADDLITRCAQAAYEATVEGRPHEPYATLPEYWKRTYRIQAEAVLREAVKIEQEALL